jgi:cytochrome c553
VLTCGRCHGLEGRGRGLGAFPSLAGQNGAYIARSLRAFAGAERRSGTMHAVASSLDPSSIAALAAHFEEQGGGRGVLLTAAEPNSPAAGPGAVQRGEQLARRGVPDRKIPSCVACHGPSEHPRNAAYPILEGQYARYLLEQLRLFGTGRRGGTEFVHLMHESVRGMTLEQMEDVAAFYGSRGAP